MANLKEYKTAIVLSFCILILLVIMILPPYMRFTNPKEEPDSNAISTISYLTCTKKTTQYEITSTTEYHDNNEYSNTITYIKLQDDENNAEITSEIKSLRAVLGVVYKYFEQEKKTTIIIDKLTRDDNTSNFEFTNYLQPEPLQKSFYEAKGYSCKSSS